MGQRLTIQIFQNKSDEKSLATIYYHWSAYTEEALNELENFLKAYNKSDHKDLSNLARIYAAVVENGGGLVTPIEEELAVDKTIEEFHITINPNHYYDRSSGLLAFSDKQQEELLYWSEGNINLYLDQDEFVFDVFSYYSAEELAEMINQFPDDFANLNNYKNIDEYLEKELKDPIGFGYPQKLEDLELIQETIQNRDFFYDQESSTIYATIS